MLKIKNRNMHFLPVQTYFRLTIFESILKMRHVHLKKNIY
jgi:hypothetical protein